MTGTQVITKLLLSVPLVVLLVLLWRSRLDLGRLGNGAVGSWLERHVTWVERREPDAVYQDGAIVGRVEGVEIDEDERLVRFHAIYSTAPLEMGRPFAFRKYQLRPRAVETLANGDAASPDRGRVYGRVTCEIVGSPPS